MDHKAGSANTEQSVDSKYIRQNFMASGIKAFEIMEEIEERNYGPEAVIRLGCCLRVRKDVFHRWISEHSVGGRGSYTNLYITRLGSAPHLRLVG